MVIRRFIGLARAAALAAAALVVLGGPGRCGAKETTVEETMLTGFLYAGNDGKVRVDIEYTGLGMWGTMGGVHEKLLSDDLAKRFEPLVNRIKALADQPDARIYYAGAIGDPNLAGDLPTVLVSLRAQIRTLTSTRSDRMGGDVVQEVIAADLVYAEQLSPEFMKAWSTLDRSLNTVVAVSLEARSPQKQAKLRAAIDSGSKALATMAAYRPSEEFRKAVAAIDPNARIVGIARRQATGDWGHLLVEFAGYLNISPKVAFPALSPTRFPVRDLLVKADSPSAFLKQARDAGGERALEQVIGYGEVAGGMWAWEVEGMDAAQFKRLQAEIAAEMSRIPPQASQPASARAGEVPAKDLGVMLSPAAPQVLADNMILAGFVVGKALPDGKNVGLKQGDVIVSYSSVADLLMRASVRDTDLFAARARYLKTITVIRGDEAMTLRP